MASHRGHMVATCVGIHWTGVVSSPENLTVPSQPAAVSRDMREMVVNLVTHINVPSYRGQKIRLWQVGRLRK